MNTAFNLNDIIIRNQLQPGDMGYITYLHGHLYKNEYNYGIEFENYVAIGLQEFYRQYDPGRDGVWICEHNNKITGFLLLMHRNNNAAQLRFFMVEPAYRKSGLGKKLMQLFMDHSKEKNFTTAYLWTTNEQEKAAALYRHFGFKMTEEKYSESFGKPLYEQKYELDLSGAMQ